METDTARISPARQRLLDTARRLFYAEGINNVGVDRLVAEAKVTKATFYRQFPSKEDLVVAYLESFDQQFRGWFEQLAAEHEDPLELLETYFDGIATFLCTADFRGCHFINAAAEDAQRGSRVAEAVRSHRVWFAQSVLEALSRADVDDPEAAADHLVMLRDGAMVEGYLDSPDLAGETLRRCVGQLLDSARRR